MGYPLARLPTGVFRRSNNFALIEFADGENSIGSCLRCHDTPCAVFSDDEIHVTSLTDFPAERNPAVCASGAILITDGEPRIDPTACVLCGICAARCPTGAIALVPGKSAIVNYDKLVVSNDLYYATRFALMEARDGGELLEESAPVIEDVIQRIWTYDERAKDTFRNLLIRNYFVHLGGHAVLRRKGVNALRMDLVAVLGGSLATVTVEFGQEAILDAPRDTLDALAVLHSRYGWVLKSTVPLIVTDILPNRRSDYWSLIQDVKRVLGIEIRTVSLLTLLLATWSRKKLTEESSRPFHVDRDLESYLTEALEVFLQRKLRIRNFQHSVLEALK